MPRPALDDDEALRRFAAYYGFEHGLLSGSDPYRIEGARPGFDGAVKRIRIVENGRFGNIVIQLFHAAWLARQLGCEEIEAFPFDGGPAAERVNAGGLRFRFPPAGDRDPAGPATLVGHFFNSYPFESALRAIAPSVAWAVMQDVLRPMFRHIWGAPAACGDQTLVVHFRAGDVFADPRVSPWYVQPPASYYQMAIAFARRELGTSDVRLVFEDRRNPAIAVTEAWLRQSGIPYCVQSSDLVGDAICLATARHLVASVSTLTEVAAILSDRLRTYIAFRQIESHLAIHQRTHPLIEGLLREKNVRLLVVRDTDGGYPEPPSWRADPDQVQLLKTYPASALAMIETASDIEMMSDADLLHRRLAATELEAIRLREALVATRGRLLRLERSRGQRMFQRFHAARRALRLPWFREPPAH